MQLRYYPGSHLHTCTSDHVSDLIGINYLNSFYDGLSIGMTRLMAPGSTAHRMNAVDQISSKNIVISAFFSTNSLACAMPDPSMLHHAFDFTEKNFEPIQTNSN